MTMSNDLNILGLRDRQQRSTMLFRRLTLEAEDLMTDAAPVFKDGARKVYEAFRYTDPVSNEMVFDINMKIQRVFSDFKDAVLANTPDTSDLAKINQLEAELLDLIKERSIICKASK